LNDAISYSNRGNGYEKKGQRQLALGEYEFAMRLDPDLQAAVEGVKRLTQTASQHSGTARRTAQEADRPPKTQPKAVPTVNVRPQQALVAPEQAPPLPPRVAPPPYAGTVDQAIEYYTEAIRLDPKTRRPLTTAAMLTTERATTITPLLTSMRRFESIQIIRLPITTAA
jgi:tetratricopeptide (TPR) repeat protein